MARKKTAKLNRLSKTLLATAEGMRFSGLMDERSYGNITKRLRVATEPKRSDVQHTSIYIPKAIYRAIRSIAIEQDCKPHDLLIEGIGMVLAENKKVQPKPAKVQRRRRTGRNAQVNIKAEEVVRDKFNSICDQEGLVGGELLKRLLEIYDLSSKS